MAFRYSWALGVIWLQVACQNIQNLAAGFDRVCTTSLTKGDPLQQIHSPLCCFNSAYDVERPLKPGRQIPLGKVGIHAHCTDRLGDFALAMAVKRLLHPSRFISIIVDHKMWSGYCSCRGR
jgi:hypothetical protein